MPSPLEQSLARVSDDARAVSTLLAAKLACGDVAEQAQRIAPLIAAASRKVSPIDPRVLAALSGKLYGRSERP